MESMTDIAPPPPLPVLVVDAANVVGSVPDGWWKDRRAATARLRDHLAVMASAAPADERIVLVTEGAARGVAPVDGVEVVEARGEGDDTIVEVVRGLLEDAGTLRPQVRVATADRELRRRVEALGAQVTSPRAVRHR